MASSLSLMSTTGKPATTPARRWACSPAPSISSAEILPSLFLSRVSNRAARRGCAAASVRSITPSWLVSSGARALAWAAAAGMGNAAAMEPLLSLATAPDYARVLQERRAKGEPERRP